MNVWLSASFHRFGKLIWPGAVASLLLLVGPVLPMSAQAALRPGLNGYKITVGTLDRTFLGYAPGLQQTNAKVPVVIMLHGFGGNSKNGLEQGKWMEKAKNERFIVLGLDGTRENPSARDNLLTNPQSWNSGSNITAADLTGVDDVAFIRAVIDWVTASGYGDPDRIYVTGFSNGAAMAFRAGAELSDLVAAIAPVSNGLFVDVPRLTRPTSLLMIWGTADPINPISGGPVRRFGVKTARPAAEDAFTTWAGWLNCPSTAHTIVDQGSVKARAYSPCDGHSEAIFYTIGGMGHDWPGGRSFLPELLVGKSSDAIDATDVIWAFFMKHPRVQVS